MTFLNAALLFGAIAAAVPLIIHLLHRTKTRVIHWGAMQFLAGAVQRKSRRLQWQQWLLLVLRCAIPALLALAMAQPALTWIGSRLGDGLSAQPIVLLDNSLAVLAPVDKPIATAEQLASSPSIETIANRVTEAIANPQLLQRGPVNDQATSSHWQINRTNKTSAIIDRFASAKHSLIDDLTTLIDQFSNSHEDDEARATLAVVTDFRRSSLSQVTADQKQRIRSLVSSNPTAPQLVLVPLRTLTESAQPQTNVAVHIDASSDAVVGPKQTGRVDFTIGNFSDQAAEDVVINVLLDGQTRGTFRATLAAGQIERRSVWLPPLVHGDHACEIVIDRKDSFILDNRAAWVVQSITPQKVLLISGSDRNSSADFMQFAIAPPELGNDETTANETVLPRQFEVVGPVMQQNRGQIEDILAKGVQHVVLCNVGRLDDDIVSKIVNATASGSLVILAGKNLDANWFNQLRLKYGDVLPFEIAAGERVNKNNQTLQFAQSANLTTGRMMLDAVAGAESAVTLQQAWSLQIEPSADSENAKNQATTDILAIDSESHPILVLRRDEARRVLVSACDFYPEDTNLPVTDVFLPLVQGFYQSFIAEQFSNRNLVCGETLPAQSADQTPLAWHVGLEVQRGSEQDTAPRDKTGSQKPQVKLAVLPGFFTANPGETSIHLAASQVPWSDSDLTVADLAAARAFATDLGANLWTSNHETAVPEAKSDDADSQQQAASVNPRFVIWRYVLAALLAALFAELLLQRQLTRRLTG
jgi:hypothetical protein